MNGANRWRKKHPVSTTTHAKVAKRVNATDLVITKNFDTSLKRARRSIVSYGLFNNAANEDGTCLMKAYEEVLRQRPEKRKVMIVFSDGYPSGRSARHGGVRRARGDVGELSWDYRERAYLKQVCEWLEKEIDLVGVGIQDDAVKSYYTEHVVVNDLEELTTQGMKIIGDKLLKRGARNAA
mgnify:CR=1 FL=1